MFGLPDASSILKSISIVTYALLELGAEPASNGTPELGMVQALNECTAMPVVRTALDISTEQRFTAENSIRNKSAIRTNAIPVVLSFLIFMNNQVETFLVSTR